MNHFADHLPYYRLEEILGRSQLTIDRSTQCRWMLRLSKALSPLTDLMRTLALKSSVVQADETPVKMLAPGQGKTSTTYLWTVPGDKRLHPGHRRWEPRPHPRRRTGFELLDGRRNSRQVSEHEIQHLAEH